MSERSTELVYRQVSAQKAVNGSAFAQGNQDFNFSVGGTTTWIPARSYFVCDMTIQAIRFNPADSKTASPYGPTVPATVDQLAFADFAPACLYNNVYFRAGGQDVSSIVNYVAQAHALRERTSKSGAWLNTIGKSSYMANSDFQSRCAQVSVDNVIGADEQEEFICLNAVQDIPATVNLVSDGAPTGVITATLAASVVLNVVVTNKLYTPLQAGDYLVVDGTRYMVQAVTGASTLTLAPSLASAATVFTIPGAANAAGVMMPWANSTVYGIRMVRRDGGRRSRVFGLYQPPIGIFQWAQPMCAGDYRFSLNPNSNFQRSIVESPRVTGSTAGATLPLTGGTVTGLVPGVDYNIIINDVKLYIATVKMSIPAEIYPLQLYEMMLQTKPITSPQSVFEFTVPSSTVDLAFWVQSATAGFSTRIPPTHFRCIDDSQNNLTQLQITYANVTKPSTKWDSKFSPAPLFPGLALANVANGEGTVNQLQQRYTDDLSETRLIESPGGAESLSEWLQRGPYYYYTFARDREDRATQVQVSVTFSATPEANCNLFLASVYSRVSEITTSDGQVQSVRGLDR